MQRSTLLLALCALIVGAALFKLKYKVVDLEQQLAQTVAMIRQEEKNIHMLQAEWSHLNDPKRLQMLAHQLDIGPVRATQVIAFLPSQEKKTEAAPQPQLASLHEAP